MILPPQEAGAAFLHGNITITDGLFRTTLFDVQFGEVTQQILKMIPIPRNPGEGLDTQILKN